ncbi:MAG: hypothetical protein HRT91_02725 [Piscirickettsiaceae bacterium]|nr:hypothetical protein [Piscirickettsiaceae bacterium]
MAIVIIVDSTFMPDVEIDPLINPRRTFEPKRDVIIDTVFKDLKSAIDDKADSIKKKKFINSMVTEVTVNSANEKTLDNFELNFFMKPTIPIVCDIRNIIEFLI